MRAADPRMRRAHTSLSYERLRGFRDELTKALFSKIQAGVESPQAFAAYARSLRIAPGPGVALGDEVVQAFVRDVFLTGNGTLFVNNTFVEWAAVQALRRAQPRVLAVRYGVRDKMKPFSSLLLFSQPRATDQIPEIEDPTGSFVDVEQLSYYVWLNAEKTSAYRDRTLYVFARRGRGRSDAAALGRARGAAKDAPEGEPRRRARDHGRVARRSLTGIDRTRDRTGRQLEGPDRIVEYDTTTPVDVAPHAVDLCDRQAVRKRIRTIEARRDDHGAAAVDVAPLVAVHGDGSDAFRETAGAVERTREHERSRRVDEAVSAVVQLNAGEAFEKPLAQRIEVEKANAPATVR